VRRALVALLLTALGASGCTRVDTAHGRRINVTTQPHVLRFADGEDVGGLNPMFYQQIDTAYLGELTMAWLFRYDRANEPVPELATEVPTKRNGDIDAPGTAIRIKLRRGVTWSDGKPFTADDVIFTTNEMNDPHNPVTSRIGFELVTKMDEPDPYTVVFHLKKPFGSFLPRFFTTGAATTPILPKHAFAHAGDLSHAAYNALPIGIGPFVFTAWHRGTDVELARNSRYWRGVPKLERVVFQIYNDSNTLLAQMQSGGVDLWLRAPGNFLSRLRAIRGVTVASGPAYTYEHYDFNVTRPALGDIAVRRALRLGVDRPAIVAKVLDGAGIVQESIVPPTYPLAPQGIALVPFDPARANHELDAAGWRRGADGIRAKHGVRLALTIVLVTGTPILDEMVELTRGWWAKLGIALNVRSFIASQLFDPIHGQLRKGDWDVALFGWSLNAVDDPTEIFGCGSFPPNGQNYGHWCDPALTPALEAFDASYDAREQARALATFDRGVVDRVPTMVLYYSRLTRAQNLDLTGYSPNAVSPLDDVMNVDI